MTKESKYLINDYLPTIGIECHVQLKTKTKLFSGVDNDSREAKPNTLVSHICFGLPGSLPVLNSAALVLASRAGFALSSRPQNKSHFDRKHYFYPDLPKGYQITQFESPIILGGKVKILVDNEELEIGITRAHLEEDAGKSTHEAGRDYSLVDLNRAGTPLLEIVSEPDIHSAKEARAYARELHLLMKFADVSEADLYYGNMRFDVNVSVSKDDKLGIRSETKNLNSFKSVEKAVDYEIKRQIELLEKGGTVVQETRGFDDAKQRTFSQRTKEDAHDYRYFPEPDIPPIEINDDFIDAIKKSMPIMPNVWRERLNKAKLDRAQIELLLESEIESSDVSYLSIINQFVDNSAELKKITNWIINVEIPLRRETTDLLLQNDKTRAHQYKEVYNLVEEGKLSSNGATDLIIGLISSHEEQDALSFATQKGLIQNSNSDELSDIIAKILKDNPKAVEDIKNGENKAIGFLVGQVMKASSGKANPGIAQKIIRDQINSL
jgi:aspartyl-tRNA(Asn)/glutamyl-tRNA(Gln) amidotransferase subunit B